MRRNDTTYSKFWMGDEEFNLDPREVSLWDAESLIKLASFKRAVANFVRIVTGKPIPVLYNTGEQSYTSGETVVLSAKLEHNQFDTAVGTALHEGSHCVLTDFKLHRYMQHYQEIMSELVTKDMFSKSELEKRFRAKFYNSLDEEDVKYMNIILGLDHTVVASLISRMFRLMGSDISLEWKVSSNLWEQSKWFENWVEDRRIDYWQTKNSPGYRGYYNAMYESYFYTKLVGKGVKAKNYARTETWESYRFRVTNILHPNTDLDALKGLREIWDIIDIHNISRLNSTLDAWVLSYRILDVMYKYVEVEKKREEDASKKIKLPGKTVRDHEYEDEIDENQEPSDEKNDSPFEQDQDDNRTGDDNFDTKQPDNMGGEEEKSDEKSDGDDGEPSDEKSDDEDGEGSGSDSDEESDEEGDEESDKDGEGSGDGEEDEDNLSPAQQKKMEKEEDKQGKFLEGETPKKKMDKKLRTALDAIESSGVSLEGVGSGLIDENGKPVKVQCVVVRKVTKELIESGTFDHMFIQPTEYNTRESEEHQKAVEEGFRLGTMLGKKLQIRNESRTTRFSRLETGRIDKRLLASLGYQNDRVFYRTMVDKYDPMMLHVSVDASGSMSGEKWSNTMTSLVAIIKAVSMTQNLNVVVSMRGTTTGNSTTVARRRRRRWGSTPSVRVTSGYSISTRPLVAIVYDSRVDKLSKVMSLFKYIKPGGATPEGLAFEPIIDEMVAGVKGEMQSIFLNLSDGEPCFGASISNGDGTSTAFSYGDENGAEHTAGMVQRMRSLNIRVLSYIIQEDDSYSEWRNEHSWNVFKNCYGRDARKINVKNIVELARTLNEKFLEKSN